MKNDSLDKVVFILLSGMIAVILVMVFGLSIPWYGYYSTGMIISAFWMVYKIYEDGGISNFINSIIDDMERGAPLLLPRLAIAIIFILALMFLVIAWPFLLFLTI